MDTQRNQSSIEQILKQVHLILAEVMDEDPQDIEVHLTTSFQNDLELESIEMIALGDTLRTHYGDHLNFASWLTQFSLEEILELKVGDLVEWIEQCQSKH